MDNPETRDHLVGRALAQLPVPDRPPDFFDRLEAALQESRSPLAARGFRPLLSSPRRVVAILAATALLSAVLGGMVGVSVQAGPQCEALSFEPADGWNTVETNVDSPGAPPAAWAANVAFQPEEDYSAFPDNTVRNLPSDGIVIVAVGPRVYFGGEKFPHFDFPIALSEALRFNPDQYEGQPASDVSNYVIDGWVDDKLLNLMVWMGTTDPDASMEQSADDQLSRLCIPGV
ncbi:MAG: hypothetical protein H0U16_11635 [Actinobacteria bacterium]|nr:hypothetical protein [Actinomycetota bacterium]